MSNNDKDKDFAPINVEINDRIPMASQRQSGNSGTTVVTKSSNVLVSITLFVAGIACVASAYLFHLDQQNREIIAKSEARIESLENRLSATGEEMGNSTVALQVKVTELSTKTEELWEQMDKLWASAWRRNQQDIKNLDGSLKSSKQSLTSSITGLESKITTSLGNITQLQNRIDGINTKVSGQANEVLAINVNREELQGTITKQNNELRQMAEKLILLEKRNTTLLQQLQQMDEKITELANKSV